MFKVRIAQRGITLFVNLRGYRARIGTWTYGSSYPGRPISESNPRKRVWCAWIEIPSEPYYKDGWTHTSKLYGHTN